MDMTAPIALKSDVLLIPVSELDPATRKSIDCGDDDVALSRPRTRTTSTVIDATAAALIEQFRTPKTIVEAVVLFSKARRFKPDDVLDDAYRLVRQMVEQGFMTAPRPDEAADATGDQEMQPQFSRGTFVAGAEVLRLIQLLEDTEVYLARHPETGSCVLKIQRPGPHPPMGLFAGEARVLETLGGVVGPRLMSSGVHNGCAFLLMEHCRGIDSALAADEHRREGMQGLPGLLALAQEIAKAYAALHDTGVIHGDVHPRNVLVQGDGSVRLIDFGLSVTRSTNPGEGLSPRGGVAFFQDPETAQAALDGHPWVPVTPAGEQYSVGALLYLLMTGVYYIDFSLGRLELLREIVERSPVPIAQRGLPAWPALEACLFKALSKRPEDRFASMADFAEALANVDTTPGSHVEPHVTPDGRVALEQAAEQVLQQTVLDGSWFTNGFAQGPTASLNYGSTGVAYVVARVARAREDPALLARADAWLCRAAALAKNDANAFLNPTGELAPEIVGTVTPYHTKSGIAAVRAMIAEMMGDGLEHARAVDDFLSSAADECINLDLTLGQCSTVVGALQILQTLPSDWAAVRQRLIEFGNERVQRVWRELGARPPVATSGINNLGMAHGWAGFIYTALLWSDVTAAPIPEDVPVRLGQLADLAEPSGRGFTWPWELSAGAETNYMSGWCNGSAGYIPLWTTAARMFDNRRYLDLAIGAGWDVWDAPDSSCTLCCGLAGRAYALLTLYRHTRDHAWLARARMLGYRAVGGVFESEYPHSLYKGQLVLPALEADLADPDRSCQPFFELEPRPTDQAFAVVNR